MVNAFSRHNYAAGFARRLMMNKSLRVRIEESSERPFMVSKRWGRCNTTRLQRRLRTSKSRARKKRAAVSGGF